jgi:hypothetical protein
MKRRQQAEQQQLAEMLSRSVLPRLQAVFVAD